MRYPPKHRRNLRVESPTVYRLLMVPPYETYVHPTAKRASPRIPYLQGRKPHSNNIAVGWIPRSMRHPPKHRRDLRVESPTVYHLLVVPPYELSD